MRKMMMVAVVMAGMLAARGAQAQLMDGSTGIMVDPSTDLSDYMAVASGQPGNAGMEMMAQMTSQAQQTTTDTTPMSMFNNDDANDSSNDDAAPAIPRYPVTPKPVIAAPSGKFLAGTAVSLGDADPAAVIFYTTDGKKPTAASARYTGPIVINAKEKVSAMAFDVNEMPSGVVSKTFKMKN